jgi:Icc-related predicted phosphoesterase
VIAPGSLSDGDYAIADIRAQEAQLEQLAATAA